MSKQVNYLEELKAEEKNLRLLQRTQGTAEQTELEHYMRNLVHKREDKGQLLSNLKEYYHFDIERDLKLMLIVPTLYMNQQPTEENFQAMSVKNVCMSMVDAQERGITFSDDDGTIAITWFEAETGDVVLDAIEELSDILKDEFDAKPKMVVGKYRARIFQSVYLLQ